MIRDKFGFCVVGGDARQQYLLQMLNDAGYRETDPAAASVLILPVPYERQGRLWCTAEADGAQGRLWRQLSAAGVTSARELLGYLAPGCRMYGGCFTEEFLSEAAAAGVTCHDFYRDEALTWKNAVATAEGTLAELIRCLPVNVTGSSGLIVGYGRCGKTTAAMLRPFGVKLRICARSAGARAQAGQYGEPVYPPEELGDAASDVDFIINTVPTVLFTGAILKGLSKRIRILDIASLPGGVDREAAEELGISYLFLPGLPGKVSPYTAALDLKAYILEREK